MSSYRPGRGPSAVHDALVRSLEVADRASAEALLWFAEVQHRHLYRARGHLSIHHYAGAELGFGARKTEQFVQLSRLVLRYRRLRASLERGRLTWTQVRTIAPVLTPASEAHWVARAEALSRRDLAREIAAARARTRERVTTPDQVRLPEPGPIPTETARPDHGGPGPRNRRGPSATAPDWIVPPTSPTSPASPTTPTTPTPSTSLDRPRSTDGPSHPEEPSPTDPPCAGEPVEVMTTLSLRLRPVERARLERALEALRKRGHRGDRAALILAAVESLVMGADANEASAAGSVSGEADPSTGASGRSRHQVVVSVCPTCRKAQTGGGRHQHAIDPVTLETLLCDADVVDEQGRRRATIPPSVRRRVLARDGHRCAARGCGSTHHLEIHHRVPVSRGGTNHPENLVVLCHACHRSLHEIARRRGRSSRGNGPDGLTPAPGCGTSAITVRRSP